LVFGFAYPPPEGLADADLSPGRWDENLGEFILDWDDVIAAPDAHAMALGFARSVVRRACAVCEWDQQLAGSVDGNPPPIA
jgi:Family of unknown function (DUF5996)